MPGDLTWLAQVREDVLDPQRAICDPHHHLWDRPSHGERYLLDELLADFGGHRVVSTVFVECMAYYRAEGEGDPALRFVGETEFVQGVAAMTASGNYGEVRACAGIVSRADLTGADVGRVLDAHVAASPNRFRGIRHVNAYDPSPDIHRSHTAPPPGLLGDAAFRRGMGELAKRGLSFDAWLYHHQIPELTALARAYPNVTIVLDHFGGPLGIGPYAGKRAEIFAQWQKDVAELARCENVVAKLGGLLMAVNGWGFEKRAKPPGSEEVAAATRDWYVHAIDQFGPRRCMFESNFPMDRVTCSYQVLWNSFKRIAAQYTEPEKSALFHDTAARVYRVS